MTHERSDEAWHGWRESSEKFDYFMAGLCSALTAYVGQSFAPTRLGLNASTLEVVALSFLCGSVVAAFKRIEMHVTALLANHRRLYHHESTGSLAAASQLTGPLINKATGELFSPADALQRAEKHKQAAHNLESKEDSYAKKAVTAYRWRSRLLYAGFSLLVIARIWKAYA